MMYNEASILLETGDENFEKSSSLFKLSIDHCQAYDSTINMVPDRAHIRLAWLCLTSSEFTKDHGLLLLDDLEFHVKRIAVAERDLEAVNEHVFELPVRYQVQYFVSLCDLRIVKGQLEEALDIARRVESVALEHGYRRELGCASSRVEYLERLRAAEIDRVHSGTANAVQNRNDEPARCTEEASNGYPQLVCLSEPSQGFDVFVSCHEDDWNWFTNELKDELLGKGLSICSLCSEFKFHLPWNRRLQSAVDESRHCIVLISQRYVDTKRTQLELQYCQSQCRENDKQFIPIRLESIHLDCVSGRLLQMFTLLEVDEEGQMNWKKRLLEML